MERELLDYLKTQKWFLGIRREEALFFYSAKYLNREELTKREYTENFVETILHPVKKDYMIRAFNLEQAKVFHKESERLVLNDPTTTIQKIDEDNKLWEEIGALSEKLKAQAAATDFKSGVETFKTLAEKYGVYGNNFFAIFSQGMALEKHKGERQDAPFLEALKKHDTWRNAVAFKEEKLGEAFFEFLDAWRRSKKMKLKTKDLFAFLTAAEILSLLEGNLAEEEAAARIKTRQENGYAYLYLRNKADQDRVIEDKKTVAEIASFFADHEKEETSKSELKGQTAFLAEQIITGEVVVINDKEELEMIKPDLKDKILVTVQTTPHFIPYLKGVKAIVTDEGGITCHASIVAREFKIPCVVGTKMATKSLKTGDLVEMDTNKGTLKLTSKE